MSIVWAGALITSTLLALVLGAIWWLVNSAMRERRRERAAARYAEKYQVEPSFVGRHQRPAHLLHGRDDTLTVAELVEEARAEGRPVRLNRGDEGQADAGPMSPEGRDEDPTGILSPITEPGE